MSDPQRNEDRDIELDQNRTSDWLARFRYYRDPPDIARITAWLKLFDECDQELASKVLDKVRVVGEPEIQQGYRTAALALEGWSDDEAERQGRWFFVGFGGAGESGPAMLRMFREANGLTREKFAPLFKSIADLPYLKLTALDHVVFVDDFSGTGRQVTRMWPTISELVASEAKCYLVLTALTGEAREAIESQTELEIRSAINLGPESCLFHKENKEFTAAEKARVIKYGRKADRSSPKGFGGMGVMFVLSHKTPNNALPILFVNAERWRGLFPRDLRAA